MIKLDNVPTKIRNGKKIYDWTNSIGTIIEIIDDDTKESVKVPIVRYDRTGSSKTIYVNYMGNEIPITTGKISKLKGNKVLGKYTGDFRFQIGDIINNIKITEQKNVNNCKKYKYRCLDCGKTGWVDENYLKNNDYKHHCTIPTTAPWMIPYFQGGYDEAIKYTYSSNKMIYPICPDCGKQSTRLVKIGNLYEGFFQCTCHDTVSYGEKFFVSFLEQLEIDFVHYFRIDGLNRTYDFYIPSINAIVEIHGGQHYIEVSHFASRTLQEEQENDSLKMQYALSHGISKYIVVDARKSDPEWLKEHIESTELCTLFDCSIIDWNACSQFATKNIIADICKYITEHPEDGLDDYMGKFHVSENTLRRYIKIGNENFEWCNIIIKRKSDKTIAIIKDGKIIGTQPTYTEAARYLENKYNIHFLESEIRRVCIGEYKQYKGYKFKIIA